ncbi:hypothetical protein Tco_0205430 [Tanacetum coccineum]
MGKWKGFSCLKYRRNSFLSSTKGFLFKLRSCLTKQAKGHKNGLVNLYKDLEACGGYEDIQVMWEMIHHSSSLNSNAKSIKRNDNATHWRLLDLGVITSLNSPEYKFLREAAVARMMTFPNEYDIDYTPEEFNRYLLSCAKFGKTPDYKLQVAFVEAFRMKIIMLTAEGAALHVSNEISPRSSTSHIEIHMCYNPRGAYAILPGAGKT